MTRRGSIGLAAFVAGIAAATAAFAQSTGGSYALERQVVAGGGGSSSGGAYALSGTIAQPEAHDASTGGTFALAGGFWVAADAEPSGDVLFGNGFE